MADEPLIDSPELDPRFTAGVKLIERTGARDFRIGHSDPDDGEPIVWYAVATYKRRPGTRARNPGEAAGALDGVTAVLRLCEQLIDGGQCMHCHQPTIFDPNPQDTPLDDLLDAMGCVYAWDPELLTFRRGCEGDESG